MQTLGRQVNSMADKKDKKELIRSIKFFLVSVSAGLVQIGSTTLCFEVFHLSETASYVIGLVLSVIWNFTINRRYTFQSASNIPIAMVKVAAFYLVFTPASGWLEGYLTGLGWNFYLVTLINMVMNLILEFLYQKYYVFRGTIDTNDVAKKHEEKAKK